VCVVAGVTALASVRAQGKAVRGTPDKRLGVAIRLIDRIVSGHNSGMAMLPKEMLDEAVRLVDEYYQR
jgi:hypothetical protein